MEVAIFFYLSIWASQMALVVKKNLPANAGEVESWVWFLGQEDPLE